MKATFISVSVKNWGVVHFVCLIVCLTVNLTCVRTSSVTDIYKGGELFDEIIKRTKFTENDAAQLMMHLLSCINYVHKNGLGTSYAWSIPADFLSGNGY